MNYKLKIKKSKNSGYTIIETMIAISLFIIIIMVGMGSLLNANLLHQKSRDQRSVLDNLSFIMEEISRNVRTGYNFYCITGGDTLSNVAVPKSGTGCWGIAFEFQDGSPSNPNDQWVYGIGTKTGDTKVRIYKATTGPYTNFDNFISLTSDEIDIDPAKSYFTITGAERVSAGDKLQPFVVIKLVGTITFKNITTPFTLQTSMSQRLIDVGN